MKKLLRAALFVSVLVPTVVVAEDYNKAFAAYLANDFAKMLEELRPLAEQGHPGAQTLLGIAHSNGLGVPEDDVEGARLYARAAKQGYAIAQFNLAVAYANGEGVDKDYVTAANWNLLAAKKRRAQRTIQPRIYIWQR